jgi:hypothetical protein
VSERERKRERERVSERERERKRERVSERERERKRILRLNWRVDSVPPLRVFVLNLFT